MRPHRIKKIKEDYYKIIVAHMECEGCILWYKEHIEDAIQGRSRTYFTDDYTPFPGGPLSRGEAEKKFEPFISSYRNQLYQLRQAAKALEKKYPDVIGEMMRPLNR